MNIDFVVNRWAAWAPGVQTQAQWQAWAQAPWLPVGDDSPALSEVAPMQRRRIERLGRMAIQTAYWCQSAARDDLPMIFASRHGDVAGSLRLLESLVSEQALSPTGFGLSVHNAIAALYSIIENRTGNYLAVAGGAATPEVAMVEAAGLLADGADEVMVVCYDASLPDLYADFAEEPSAFHAWCWQVAAGDGSDAIGLSCGAGQASTEAPSALLPHNLDVLRWWLSGDRLLQARADASHWQWQRHG
ncbi:beta-ketoacyl synthase chain length factor [Pseudoxanthomonas dokdonensis]|uniref:3-oxoacyl-ACP synthase n=1 Tax=Pseudoxanthomonas dokdonensis TaxID=344882 RepID=A0A0R0CNX1_9GAMM|nr:beta-ketoacyl synthase chain length factor [Pseudoxanthomonas dokdonensis]KRG71216.1 3-oxoacyl-ACP synthase [Pseudoxanthomonas dokdonensis]